MVRTHGTRTRHIRTYVAHGRDTFNFQPAYSRDSLALSTFDVPTSAATSDFDQSRSSAPWDILQKMMLLRTFVVIVISALVVDSFRINCRSTTNARSAAFRLGKVQMAATTDELAIAYEQIKQQVKLP